MQNIPPQFAKLTGCWDGKNASLLKLKLSILSDVDSKDGGSRLCLHHKKNNPKLLVQMHILNKDNGLKFLFSLSVQRFIFHWWHPGELVCN